MMRFDNIRYDENGIFTFSMGEQTECHNPSEVAMQAMLGRKVMDVYQAQQGILRPEYIDIECIGNNTEDEYAYKAKEWLLKNYRLEKNRAIWDYDYEVDYHGKRLGVPWYSAFAQAYVAEALMYWSRFDNKRIYKTLAKKAIRQLIYPIEKGGCCNKVFDGVWFEEIPYGKYTHIFNAQLASIITLLDAKKYLKMWSVSTYITKALTAFEDNIYRMDTGINSVYEMLDEMNIEVRISPCDETPVILKKFLLYVGDEKRELDLGDNSCFEGTKEKISGTDWVRDEKEQLLLIKKESGEQHNYLYFYDVNANYKQLSLFIEYETEKDTIIELEKNCYEMGYKKLGNIGKIILPADSKEVCIIMPSSTFLPHLSNVYHMYHINLLKGIIRRYPKKIYSELLARFESYI